MTGSREEGMATTKLQPDRERFERQFWRGERKENDAYAQKLLQQMWVAYRRGFLDCRDYSLAEAAREDSGTPAGKKEVMPNDGPESFSTSIPNRCDVAGDASAQTRTEGEGSGTPAAPLDIDRLNAVLGRLKRAVAERDPASNYACALFTQAADSDGCGTCLSCMGADLNEITDILEAADRQLAEGEDSGTAPTPPIQHIYDECGTILCPACRVAVGAVPEKANDPFYASRHEVAQRKQPLDLTMEAAPAVESPATADKEKK